MFNYYLFIYCITNLFHISLLTSFILFTLVKYFIYIFLLFFLSLVMVLVRTMFHQKLLCNLLLVSTASPVNIWLLLFFYLFCKWLDEKLTVSVSATTWIHVFLLCNLWYIFLFNVHFSTTHFFDAFSGPLNSCISRI